MKLLMTGFDPFGGETVNPSWEALTLLPDQIGGASLFKNQLPTAFRSAGRTLLGILDRLSPDAVICVGQAGGIIGLRIERLAVNLMDARIPDNEGFQPADTPVLPGGPAARFSTLPVRQMVQSLTAALIPADLSMSAGTFVCNSVFYTLLDWQSRHAGVPCGFIHVPYLPSQAAGKVPPPPSMPLSDTARGLRIAAEAVLAFLVHSQP